MVRLTERAHEPVSRDEDHMSELSVKEGLNAMDVASYLRRHPEFLREFPDIAMALVLPREQGQAASLASYQLDVLRDKNRELGRRLHELSANAEANERLAVRTHQLTLSLLRQASAADPKMRVLIVHGWDDLSCPYFVSRLVIDQMPITGDPSRVKLAVYPGGHMFYSRPSSQAAFREDVKAVFGVK